MKSSILGILIWALAAGVSVADQRPVVVELFTSQGCSSCPPADALLAELAPRDDVIALALHVDYWDYIGWKDTFGNPQFSQRQKRYAHVAGERSVFTPQMVVQGVDHVIGYQPMKLAELIANHFGDSSDVDLDLRRNGNALSVSARAARPFAGSAIVHLVRYRPLETVKISRGENAGNAISYANIVTSWEQVGKWDGKRPLQLRLDVSGTDSVVVLIQREGPREVLAAARLR